mmetsp:Transcript_7836/g.11938  ORF Transcript_7836/g.11938 Transcript_7836/m.11938 type:complete len:463 (-) Transcript_7836:261-1649(-)|eukprot:CAMPEP_0113944326 /NCGR_PEP_ID=MMETSP1339-20121228/33328_1 /TAXON_ID=94617 /ORGANISM="Fibrocapsa japonica" /LENGTH=462 /DNA_ID=CAMNT_0000949493 /DNA_START=92 /DNA_END=1480 /DNA_ORIENTATION=- /assembly_acc=CAM_ASM_000762
MVAFSSLAKAAVVVSLASPVTGFTQQVHAPLKNGLMPVSTHSVRVESALSMSLTEVDGKDKKKERKRIMGTDRFNRRGFKDSKEYAESTMIKDFKSDLVEGMNKAEAKTIIKGDVTVKLADKYGLCWGVDRAIALTYEARHHYDDKKIHITNELIHNPQVNEKLTDMGVDIISVEDGTKNFDNVDQGDVVVLPAFGASLEEMQLLDQKGVQIVDTTCPWVSKVWNVVDKHVQAEMTSVIHGKYGHEETIATASFAKNYLVIKNIDEAEYVCNYILSGGDKEEFMAKFSKAVSKGFDPDVHLEKIGLANQTTMYKKETRAIGQLMQKTIMRKYGPDKVQEHYLEMDTICDATQERQDAIHDLVEDDSVDVYLIVGGFESSNTAHLLEIPKLAGKTAYHVDRADRIRADGSIEHRTLEGKVEVTENWLPQGKVVVGVTSGASTPDAYVQACLENIFMLKSVQEA